MRLNFDDMLHPLLLPPLNRSLLRGEEFIAAFLRKAHHLVDFRARHWALFTSALEFR